MLQSDKRLVEAHKSISLEVVQRRQRRFEPASSLHILTDLVIQNILKSLVSLHWLIQTIGERRQTVWPCPLTHWLYILTSDTLRNSPLSFPCWTILNDLTVEPFWLKSQFLSRRCREDRRFDLALHIISCVHQAGDSPFWCQLEIGFLVENTHWCQVN